MKRPGTYRIGQRVKRPKNILFTLAFTIAGMSLYGLYATHPPSFTEIASALPGETLKLPDSKTQLNPLSVHIPTIGATFPYAQGDKTVLEDSGWHRYPERGGIGFGNFIIAAHRYRTGITPNATVKKSPLYHIDKLSAGDKILITDNEGKAFYYTVKSLEEVSPDDIQIESVTRSNEHFLTLYACTLGGVRDGRIVVRATLDS